MISQAAIARLQAENDELRATAARVDAAVDQGGTWTRTSAINDALHPRTGDYAITARKADVVNDEGSQVEIARLAENDELRDAIARVRSWSHDCRTYDKGYLQAQGHARELLDGATVFTLSANGDRGGRSL